MGWIVSILPSAQRAIGRLDRTTQRRIAAFIDRIGQVEDPRQLLDPYTGPLKGYWKKRVGDYRVICDLQHERLTVLVISVGHRSEIYRR